LFLLSHSSPHKSLGVGHSASLIRHDLLSLLLGLRNAIVVSVLNESIRLRYGLVVFLTGSVSGPPLSLSAYRVAVLYCLVGSTCDEVCVGRLCCSSTCRYCVLAASVVHYTVHCYRTSLCLIV